MKANELMIGDWVYDTILKGNTRVEIISLFGIKGDFHENVYNENTFEPIPITPEILEKNGFSQDPLNGHIFIFDKNPGEVIYYEFGPKYGLTIDNQLATIQDLKIKHIHELQHVLRLCGIEKEIEL